MTRIPIKRSNIGLRWSVECWQIRPLRENVYNMDETKVMLSMIGFVEVLVREEDLQAYRGARVKPQQKTLARKRLQIERLQIHTDFFSSATRLTQCQCKQLNQLA
jgi:hypothetical protein